ncbi:fibrinogen-like protein 1 [Mya arenaria]|uniref:fibrinogen-like protein 1 n=1 Tax=Mya arenaria TaxID=6604 RepID=UPI0022E3D66E|nr:fibrinogen-like protein 1 [Mya arenaria]
MTSRANMTLRMDMSLPNGTTGFDEYSGFYISPPDLYTFNLDRRINSKGMSNYRVLSQTGQFDIRQSFSTYDKDRDHWMGNCARSYGGGWWFSDCTTNMLNGHFDSEQFLYLSFQRYRPNKLKTSTMMFRSSN